MRTEVIALALAALLAIFAGSKLDLAGDRLGGFDTPQLASKASIARGLSFN